MDIKSKIELHKLIENELLDTFKASRSFFKKVSLISIRKQIEELVYNICENLIIDEEKLSLSLENVMNKLQMGFAYSKNVNDPLKELVTELCKVKIISMKSTPIKKEPALLRGEGLKQGGKDV